MQKQWDLWLMPSLIEICVIRQIRTKTKSNPNTFPCRRDPTGHFNATIHIRTYSTYNTRHRIDELMHAISAGNLWFCLRYVHLSWHASDMLSAYRCSIVKSILHKLLGDFQSNPIYMHLVPSSMHYFTVDAFCK